MKETPPDVMERGPTDIQALAELGNTGPIGGKRVKFDDLATDGRSKGSRHSPLSKPRCRRGSAATGPVIKVVRDPVNKVLRHGVNKVMRQVVNKELRQHIPTVQTRATTKRYSPFGARSRHAADTDG